MQPLQSSEARCIATGQYAVFNIQGCPLQCLPPPTVGKWTLLGKVFWNRQTKLSARCSCLTDSLHAFDFGILFYIYFFIFLSKFSLYCKYELIKSELKGLNQNSIASKGEIFMRHQGKVL